jgi:hypothetical protein
MDIPPLKKDAGSTQECSQRSATGQGFRGLSLSGEVKKSLPLRRAMAERLGEAVLRRNRRHLHGEALDSA